MIKTVQLKKFQSEQATEANATQHSQIHKK